MKRAIAYHRKERIWLMSLCETTDGVLIVCDRIISIPENEKERLGMEILGVLECSKGNVPHPHRAQWGNMQKEMLNAVGEKSYSSFVKGNRGVQIRFDSNIVSFVPMKNFGPKEGFEEISGKKRMCAPIEDELTAALLNAFEDCEFV